MSAGILGSGAADAIKAEQAGTEDAEPAYVISIEPEDAQPTRSEEHERGAAEAGIARGGQPMARHRDAVRPEQSGRVKAPNAKELEPGRKRLGPPEAIRIPCAARRVAAGIAGDGKQKAQRPCGNWRRMDCSDTEL